MKLLNAEAHTNIYTPPQDSENIAKEGSRDEASTRWRGDVLCSTFFSFFCKGGLMSLKEEMNLTHPGNQKFTDLARLYKE